jgi:hypothetical protein
MGGYVVTGLRDTPISTSGIWDDFGQAKWTAEEFRRVNDDAVLCLDVGRRRKWFYGGDRPDRLEAHTFWAGERAHWHVLLHAIGMRFPRGSELRWQLSGPGGEVLDEGRARTRGRTQPGAPSEVGIIACDLPVVENATALRLRVELHGEAGQAVNEWPVWVYPALGEPPRELVILDPTGILVEAGDWLNPAPRLARGQKIGRGAVLLSTVWDEAVGRFVEAGGRGLLLQQGEAPLPALRCPFWREAIKFFAPHPVWEKFPQRGFTDVQFFSVASDVAFDSQAILKTMPQLGEIRPMLRRLDARQYRVSDYLFEARPGSGVLLACSLRVQGGAGGQSVGWQRNAAGASLLRSMLEYLADDAGQGRGTGRRLLRRSGGKAPAASRNDPSHFKGGGAPG